MSIRKIVGKETVIVKSRPFQSLFNDAEYFLSEAKIFHDRVQKSKTNNNEFADQNYLRLERANSRASIIASVAGLEAFANSVLSEFRKRQPNEMDADWLTRKHKEVPLDRWSLKDKINFLPSLCNSKVKHPECFFDMNSESFKLFKEIVEVRNTLAHGRIVDVKYVVTLFSDRKHEADSNYPENMWQVSKFPKEISALRYNHALQTNRNIIWVLKSLISFLDSKIDRKYLLEQEFKTSRGTGNLRREYSASEPNWIGQVI